MTFPNHNGGILSGSMFNRKLQKNLLVFRSDNMNICTQHIKLKSIDSYGKKLVVDGWQRKSNSKRFLLLHNMAYTVFLIKADCIYLISTVVFNTKILDLPFKNHRL